MNSKRCCSKVSPLFALAVSLLLRLPIVLAGTPVALAQVDRAVLEGTVTDPSGGVIVGAGIKAVAIDTGLTAEQTTNSKGYYRFPGLAVGRYTLTVTSAGFKTKVVDDVVLRVGETRTQDVQLAVGAINEKIEVKADMLANRSSAEAATVIDTTQIANLPNNGRDWASFTLLAPFAQDDGGGDQRTIRFAGRARDDNNFSIDGVDAGGIQEQAQKSQTRLQISQDAVEEYRVNSALYDAEYGTQAGGQIDVETKHGTNDYHGTIFGYFRNSVFDARNFNDYDINGNPAIPPFRMGQYGLTFGGPIQKDKTFFFISYEGLRQLQSITQQFSVPAGFGQNNIAANSNLTYQQLVLNTSPQMCAILQAFPWRASAAAGGPIHGCSPRFVYPDAAFQWLGQDPSASNYDPNADTLTAPTPTTVHEDTWLLRIDHQISQKTLLYGRAQRDISFVDAPNGSSLPGDKLQTINHPANYLIALEHTFTPTIFNEVKGYINREPFHNPQSSILTYAVSTPSSFVSLNDNTADIEIGSTFGVVDNLTWVHGRHAFKMGMEYRRVRLNQGQTADNTLSFASEGDMVNANLSKLVYIAPWCCHGLRRNFIMPYFQDEWKITPTITLTAGLRWDYYGVAHEATNRTTVFDFSAFHGVCLGSGSFNVAPSPGPINTPPCPKDPALYQANYRNFDPRLALAWAPAALHGKTVIRSGFGIYHGAAQNDDLNAGLESDTFRVQVNPPTDNTGNTLPFPLEPAYEQTAPDLSNVPQGTSPTKLASHPRALWRQGRRDLYAETWGLTMEHQLPSNFLFSAQYLGSRGVHLFSRGGVNLCTEPVTFNPVDGDCVRTLDQFYPGGNPFGSVDSKRDIGSSTYNGLGLSLERRFSQGLSFQARYTWSHSINDGSVGGGESNGPENVNCLECDKGPSIFDVRHNVTVDAVYELPFGPGKTFLNSPGVLGKVIGGWQFSSIGLWHTGHPLTVTMDLGGGQNNGISLPASNPDSAFNGQAFTYLLPDGNDQTTQRPDIIPGVPLTLSHPTPLTPATPGSPLINFAAFAPPPSDANGNFTRYGNEPNGAIRALDSWQIDFALTKETKLTERVTMAFAVQAFNIFNHVQLGDPSALNVVYNTPVNSPAGFLTPQSNFGIISTTVNFNNNNDNKASPNTGTGLPRQLQFMVRVKF
jgi:hypothetical protein